MSAGEYERGVADGLTAAADAVERFRLVMVESLGLTNLYDQGADAALTSAVEMLRGTQVVEDYR